MTAQRFSRHRSVPYSACRMFDVVADIERYHEFLPGWREARILERGHGILLVDQALGFSGLNIRFASRAMFRRPDYLRISAVSGPFRSLEIHWGFRGRSGQGCDLQVRIEFEFRSRLLAAAVAPVFAAASGELLPRFEERARRFSEGERV